MNTFIRFLQKNIQKSNMHVETKNKVRFVGGFTPTPISKKHVFGFLNFSQNKYTPTCANNHLKLVSGFTPTPISKKHVFGFLNFSQNKYTPTCANNHLKLVSGFTLIETLVALFIFLIAFTALSQVSTSSMQDIHLTKRKLTAQYLAEEGVEFVKFVQKEAVADGDSASDFLALIDTACGSGNQCDYYFNPFSGSGTIGYAAYATDPMLYNENGLIAFDASLYSGTTAPSEYFRFLSFTDVTDVPYRYAVEVESSVCFQGCTPEYTATVKSVLYFDF